MSDQFGATPLPPVTVSSTSTPLEVWYDPSSSSSKAAQQPHAQQVAAFEAVPNEDCKNGSLLDVNQHFCVYAVKNGLLRVLHRHSSVRSLLRGHTCKITDVSFFQNGDVLGTVGGNLLIWRIFYTSPEIRAEKLLEIPSTLQGMTRLVWHPFNPNQFWLLHTRQGKTVATLVETTRITTTTSEDDGHAVCQLYNEDTSVIMNGAVLIRDGSSSVTDLAWSGKDTRHVMTSHENGKICLWNVKQLSGKQTQENDDGLLPATCIVTIQQQEEKVTRCMFLPHDNIASHEHEEGLTSAFLTASRGNSVITLWSAFYETKNPTKLQVFGMQHPSPDYNLDLVYGQAPPDKSPPAFFVLLSDRSEGKVYTLHLETVWSTFPPKRALAVGLDYVTPFELKFPIYSWSIACIPAENVSEEEEPTIGGLNFDVRFFAYQSKMVQQYTVPHYMCLPPSASWSPSTPGVRVSNVETSSVAAAPVSTVDTSTLNVGMEHYEEEYELEEVEEDDDDDDEYEAPAASALPVPDGLDDAGAAAPAASSANPFANWLGAIAAKTTGGTHALGNVPPPPTPVTSVKTPAVIPPELAQAAPMPSMMMNNTGSAAVLLKPGELLSPGSMSDIDQAMEALPSTNTKSQQVEPKKKKRDKSPKPNGGKNKQSTNPSNPPKIAILKRGDEPPPAMEAVVAVSSASSASVSSDLEEVLKKTLAAHFKRQESFISDQVQKAVKSEMQTTVVPTLSKMMTQTMEQAVVKPVKAAIDKNVKERTKVQTDVIVGAVSTSVEEPLKNAFELAMTTALVPAYEQATREMFLQVASSLEKGLAGSQSNDPSAMEALAAKLDAMSSKMESLTSEVTQLRSAVASQGMSAANLGVAETKAPPQPDAGQIARETILGFLQRREYEAAFTQALSASAADMAVFCCKNANVSDVLGGNAPALSQPILLCLMQQLGAVLVSSSDDDLQTILLWLQEIALTLDPADESINRHVPGVLQQLVASIDKKMAQGDPTLRRPLQMLLQVIRGMQR